jgi:hypothetical protein
MLKWPTEEVLRRLPDSHTALLVRDPITANLALLQRWGWFEPIGPNIYRMARRRDQLPSAKVQATMEADAASSSGRQIVPPTTLRCTPGIQLSIPGGPGTASVRLDDDVAPSARVLVDGLAPLPPFRTLVLSPDAVTGRRPFHTVACRGTAAISVAGGVAAV